MRREPSKEEAFRVLRVTSNLFRGPQPEHQDLMGLKGRGLKAVINLRAEADDSRYFCKDLGLSYLQLPVEDWGVPSEQQALAYLDFLAQKENQPAFVHCWAGVGRTGLFVCCYRISVGMETEDAIQASDLETPGNGMSPRQRDWLRAFARKHGPRPS